MGKWEPIVWIFAVGLGCFALFLVLEFLKDKEKKRLTEGDSGVDA